MAKFAVSGFAITSDVLPCSDPWGQGMVFKMHRLGSRRHKQYQRERIESDPITARAITKKVRRELEAARKPEEPKVVNGAPVVVTDTSAAPAPARDEFQECFLEAVDEALEKGTASVFEILSARNDSRDLVVALCAGWSGVKDENGADVPFSAEALGELLDVDALAKEGYEYEGEPVGEALVKHLHKFVHEHSLARAKYLEAGEKNSDGSSAGA